MNIVALLRNKPVSVQRFVTGFALIGLTLILMSLGLYGAVILSVLVVGITTHEWNKMIRISYPAQAHKFFLSITFATLFLAASGIEYGAFSLVFICAAFSFFLSGLTWRRGFLWFGIGLLYTTLPFLSFIHVLVSYKAPLTLCLWLALVAIGHDVGGYFFGRLIKGPPLAKVLSPKKTWSGFAGGIFLSLLFSFFVYRFFTIKIDYDVFLMASFLLSIIAALGDLLESAVKRYHGVKNSGNCLPGHGGALDRFDSIFAVFTVFYILQALTPSQFEDMKKIPNTAPSVFLESNQDMN